MDERSRRWFCFLLLAGTILALQAAPVIAGQAASRGTYRTPVRPGDELDPRWGRPELYVNLARRPRGIGASRFRYLVHKSARQWGVRVRGVTRRLPLHGDGINVIGFSRTPRGNIGDTLDTATLVDGSPARREFDVRLNFGRRWAQGPSLPASTEWDLETVILHELGHVGGARHTPRCLNSPMAPGLVTGEWWRGYRDWFRYRCSDSTAVRPR
jgi:hypothetical protein